MISSISSFPLEFRGAQRNGRTHARGNSFMNMDIYIGENAFSFQTHKSGQSVSVSYAEGSTPEDPIVRITGNAHSGKFDETIHIKDIDPRNATYGEIFALMSHLQKTGQAECPTAIIGGLPYDTSVGDFAAKCDYTKVLSSDVQRNQQYNRPMAAVAQQFLNIYEAQAQRYDASHFQKVEHLPELVDRAQQGDTDSLTGLPDDAWKDFGTAPLDDLAKFEEKFQGFDLDRVLSKEQLAALKEKYDLTEMTPENYKSMVNDLYEMGVFDEKMKDILLRPPLLKPVRVQGWKEISGTPFAYGIGYSEAGQVYDMSEGLPWQNVNEKDLFSVVKYLASFDYYDPDRGGYCKTETGLVFDRLLDVLNKISQ